MKLVMQVVVILFLVQALAGSPIVILEEPADYELPILDPPEYLYELFVPIRQGEFIVNGKISIGPKSYSVYDEYTITERQRMWQECQKDLIYNDTDTLLYAYQYLIKPSPFPYEQFPLAIPAPTAIGMALLGFVAVLASRLKMREE